MNKLSLSIIVPVAAVLVGASILEGVDGFAKALIMCSAVWLCILPMITSSNDN